MATRHARLAAGALVVLAASSTAGCASSGAYHHTGGVDPDLYVRRADQAARAAAAHPREADMWASLARLRVQEANTGDRYDAPSASFTRKGRAVLAEVRGAWDHYLALDPDKPDTRAALQVALALSQGSRADAATGLKAIDLAVAARPASAGLYVRQAQLAYRARDARAARRATGAALARTPAARMASVKAMLAKARGAAGAGA